MTDSRSQRHHWPHPTCVAHIPEQLSKSEPAWNAPLSVPPRHNETKKGILPRMSLHPDGESGRPSLVSFFTNCTCKANHTTPVDDPTPTVFLPSQAYGAGTKMCCIVRPQLTWPLDFVEVYDSEERTSLPEPGPACRGAESRPSSHVLLMQPESSSMLVHLGEEASKLISMHQNDTR